MKIKLELTPDEMNVILVSLGRQPWDAVNGLIGRIRHEAMQQLAEQQKAEQKAAAPPPVADKAS